MHSLISPRWRNLWQQSLFFCRYIFSSFPGGKRDNTLSPQALLAESPHLISWVAKFLGLIRHNPTIHEFILRCNFEPGLFFHIDEWLHFAFNKSVQRLELDLFPYFRHYKFPSLEKLSSDNLRHVCFKHVDVDGKTIEYMLSKCHSLEHLSIKKSNTLLYLNLSAESVALKHLQVVDCDKAENINISSPSLVSFKYCGSRSALCVGNVPSLKDLCIGGRYCRAFLKGKDLNLHCVSQLKKIKLNMSYKVVKKCVHYPFEFPNFISLERLEVKMEMCNGLFLLWPTLLIKAAPVLHTFAIKLKYVKRRKLSSIVKKLAKRSRHCNYPCSDEVIVGRTPLLTEEVKSKIENASKKQHECLKVVEVRNFVGNSSDLPLVKHLLSMPFRSLEEVVLCTSVYTFVAGGNCISFSLGSWFQKRSRERAVQAVDWLPSSSTRLVLS